MRRNWGVVLGWIVAMCVLQAGCSSGTTVAEPPAKSAEPAATAVPSADGITFVKGGVLQVVADGKLVPVPAAQTVRAVGRGADSGGVVVEDTSGSSAGQLAWYAPGEAKPTLLWRSKEAGNLGTVRYLKNRDSVWFSVFGDPDAVLKSAAPPSGDQLLRALDPGFNGEFDVDASGEAIAYVGKGQEPSTLWFRDAEGSTALPVKVALVFSPDLSSDASRVCFVGGLKASELSVWVYDLDGGKPTELKQTRGLAPTEPVFSADGSRIVFRSGTDGTLWVVDAKQGTSVKLPFVADEGPVGW